MRKTFYALAMLAAGGCVFAAGVPGTAVGAGTDAVALEAPQTGRIVTEAQYQRVDWNSRSRWRCWWRHGERYCGWW